MFQNLDGENFPCGWVGYLYLDLHTFPYIKGDEEKGPWPAGTDRKQEVVLALRCKNAKSLQK